MAKKRKAAPLPSVNDSTDEATLAVEMGRGTIKDNALKAVVTSKVFRTQVVKAKKGKGSFKRFNKHKGKEPYAKPAKSLSLHRAFLYLSITTVSGGDVLSSVQS